ncbi:MAG: hypothetical protein V7707_01625 [Motiliproteus sp.]
MESMPRWYLVVVMVGRGMTSSFKELAAMEWRRMTLMVAETVLICL